MLAVATALLWPPPAAAEPVLVRFTEGITHGFLTLRTPDGRLIAAGDLMQVARRGAVESRIVFHFKDGSLWDETVVYTQERVFTLQSYRLLQKGLTFAADSEVSLERAAATYRVKTTARDGGKEAVLDGAFTLPPDTYNGMVVTVTKNLARGARETGHLLVFTPTARLIQLEIAPAGEHKVLVGHLVKSATRYVLTPKLGAGSSSSRRSPDACRRIRTPGSSPTTRPPSCASRARCILRDRSGTWS
jgi:hypothetical protein